MPDHNDKRHQTVFLHDGRLLGFAECGDPRGRTIFYFHGLPSSRLEAAIWHASALKHHFRLIAPDRPGMGLSTFDEKRKVTCYPADIAELCLHLDVHEFAILGVSGGGMYALACAARLDLMPGIQSIVIVAGIRARDLPQSGMSWMQRLAYAGMDWIPGSLIGWFWDHMVGKAARDLDPSILENLVKKSMKAAPKLDREFAADEEIVSDMTEALRASFVQGSKGYVKEATLATAPWNIDYGCIQDVPVRLWYGAKDGLAPPSVGKALASHIDPATCVVLENEGHTGIVMKHQDRILQEILGVVDDE